MDVPVRTYNTLDYVETESGNKINRSATVCGPQNISLLGKTVVCADCIIRGDLRRVGGQTMVVTLGKYCFLERGVVVRPPNKTFKGSFTYFPIKIGNCVHIEQDTVIEAAVVGSNVHIGRNCVIGNFAILKDCCRIEDNSYVPPNTVVPSFAVFAGNPAVQVDELPECVSVTYEAYSKELYGKFVPKTPL